MTQTPTNNNTIFDTNTQNTATDMEKVLTEVEKDTLGEIGNICMGTSATTLSSLLGKRVTITTPRVSLCRGKEYLNDYERPMVATEVSYTQGITGTNVFLIKKDDALEITKLLIGSAEGVEEMYLSAMSEVMNQMVGSSSTALANLLHIQVNISPPVTKEIARETGPVEPDGELLIKTSFCLEIEGLLKSSILQIMPFEFGKKLVRSLNNDEARMPQQPAAPQPAAPAMPPASAPAVSKKEVQSMPNEEKVELKEVKFQSFDAKPDEHFTVPAESGKNIDLIIDVPLQVTVVLGKARKSIKEILDFNRGSLIVLDRLAGEMVDVLVNGKLFAKGEVVVVDDNYGVRITEIISDPGKEN